MRLLQTYSGKDDWTFWIKEGSFIFIPSIIKDIEMKKYRKQTIELRVLLIGNSRACPHKNELGICQMYGGGTPNPRTFEICGFGWDAVNFVNETRKKKFPKNCPLVITKYSV